MIYHALPTIMPLRIFVYIYGMNYILNLKSHCSRAVLFSIKFWPIDQFNKSHNAPAIYPTIHHSEQKCAHFCSEWRFVGYGTGASWDLWDWSNAPIWSHPMTFVLHSSAGGRFKKTYELLNLRALKISPVNKIHIFQCMSKIFCVEFQRYPLKFHTKYLTHTLKDTIFIQHWNFKSS